MDDTTVDAGNSVQFPVAVNISATLGGAESLATGAVKIRGTKRLRMRVLAVADGQDAEFSVSLRVTGRSPAIPTRTAVGQGTEVVTVNHSVMDFLED